MYFTTFSRLRRVSDHSDPRILRHFRVTDHSDPRTLRHFRVSDASPTIATHVFYDTFASPTIATHVFYDTFASPTRLPERPLAAQGQKNELPHENFNCRSHIFARLEFFGNLQTLVLTSPTIETHVFYDTFASPTMATHVFYDTFAFPTRLRP